LNIFVLPFVLPYVLWGEGGTVKGMHRTLCGVAENRPPVSTCRNSPINTTATVDFTGSVATCLLSLLQRREELLSMFTRNISWLRELRGIISPSSLHSFKSNFSGQIHLKLFLSRISSPGSAEHRPMLMKDVSVWAPKAISLQVEKGRRERRVVKGLNRIKNEKLRHEKEDERIE
jgi:hypothetical protein